MSLIAEITRLVQHGLSDIQIGARLNLHHKTIAYHRKRNDIGSGRSHKKELSRLRRGQTMHKRSYSLAVIGDKAPGGKLRHGLNALAPITCRGDGCPYWVTCRLTDPDRHIGEPCATVIAFVAYFTQGYCQEFQIDGDNIADMASVRRLVDLHIKMMRCDSLLASNPVLMRVVWDIDERPRPLMNPVSRYHILLLEEHGRVFSGLRAVTAV